VRDSQTGQVRQTFASGPLRVAAVCFSPDGSRLATGGADGTVRVWDVASGHELVTLLAGDDTVTGVAWVGDRVFAAAGGVVHAWGWGAD
jgi:WD40 repeat protein